MGSPDGSTASGGVQEPGILHPRRAHERFRVADLAAGLGFPDQAHLARSCTGAVSVPPASYAAAENDRGAGGVSHSCRTGVR